MSMSRCLWKLLFPVGCLSFNDLVFVEALIEYFNTLLSAGCYKLAVKLLYSSVSLEFHLDFGNIKN